MLTFVPTPLGNLRDVTIRALDELRDCDLIVAEDTRVARRLLAALDLPSKTLWSYREQNAAQVTAQILERATEGRVVVVTDAGMPGISDPGSELVRAARAAGVAIDVLPGPCAFVTAAVLSGFAYDELVFAGFVPRRAGERDAALAKALAASGITAFYESPNRIVATLESLAKFEQHAFGSPRSVLAALERPVRGEIVLIVAGGPEGAPHTETTEATGQALARAIDAALAAGTSHAHIAKALSKDGFGDRASLYRAIVSRANALNPRAKPSR
jgi:16S rRNA (cytidine1402-2'-O)-methyltransferase